MYARPDPVRKLSRPLRSLLALSACLGAVASLSPAAQAEEGRKTLSAQLTDAAPRIDGVLDEPLWQTAEPGTGFVQAEPDEGKPASLETVMRVAYDRGNLYISAHMLDDDPKRIACRLTRRDRESESDWFGVFIDSYHDHKTGRFFMVNAAGVQRDGSISNDNELDDAWDGVWASAIRCTNDGWDVEMRIPFSALRFAALEDATWGINAIRYISRKKEQAFWTPVSRSDSRLVSGAGHLVGIRTMDAPKRVSIAPYGASSASLTTDGEGVTGTDFGGRLGIDLQYGVTTDLTLDLTVYPDFGQVEVDQAVINLTAFETYYPEKRPFFLEGADIFNTAGNFGDGTPTRLFYSRNIGGMPIGAGSVEVPEGGELLEDPSVTPILSAAKVSGRTSKGLSLGFLDAVTGETYARVREADGSEREVLTSPHTNYGVARLKQEVGGSSYVGGMVTAVNRLGADASDAYAGAADGTFRTTDGRYSVQAVAAASSVIESGEATNGLMGRVIGVKEAGSRMVAATSYGLTTPEFNITDLGYMQRAGEHGGWAWMQLRDLDGLGPFRTVRLNHNAWGTFLLDQGLPSDLGGNVNANLELKSYWFSWLGVGGNSAAYDAYESRVSGLLFHRPANVYAFAGVQTDTRKPVWLSLQATGVTDTAGARSLNAQTSLEMRLNSRTELSLGSSVSLADEELAFALLHDPSSTARTVAGDTVSVFGRRDLQQMDAWIRGTLTFTERLSLQFFGQLLNARGTYSDLQELGADGELEPLSFVYDPALHGSPDFTTQLFNANVILRWEYLPGSTFYAVWTQSRMPDDTTPTMPLSDTVARTFTRGSSNAVMLKLSYRWGT